MTRLEGLACAIGVVAGSFGWFSLVAWLTHRGKSVLGEKAAWIPRIVGGLLMGLVTAWLLPAMSYYGSLAVIAAGGGALIALLLRQRWHRTPKPWCGRR